MSEIKEYSREVRTRISESFVYIFFIASALFLAMFAFRNVNSGKYSILIQVLGILLALSWAIIQVPKRNQNIKPIRDKKIIDWIWLGLIVALLLRFFATTIFPPQLQTGFEEIQTGSNAYRILLNNNLPIEFRFTNIIGSLGFLFGGKITLPSLRFFFQVGGLLTLVIFFYALKSININKVAILTTVLLAAVNKFLVIGSGTADELFAGIIFLFGFLYCIIRIQQKSEYDIFWTGLAGIFDGILFYEYISYRIPMLFLSLWFVITLLSEKGVRRRKVWLILFTFIFCWFVVAMATIIQTIKLPSESVFFEGIKRHLNERNTFFVSDYLIQLVNNFKAVFGFVTPISAFYTSVGTPLYSPVYGGIFFLSLIYNLFIKKAKLSKGFSFSVLITIVSISVFTNNNNTGRISPVLPVLFLLTGDMLAGLFAFIQNQVQKLQPKSAIVFSIVKEGINQNGLDSQIQSGEENSYTTERTNTIYPKTRTINLQSLYKRSVETILSLILVSLLSLVMMNEISVLRRMATDGPVLNEYVNNEYAVCSFIGRVYEDNPHVFYISESGRNICASTLPEAWYYNGKIFSMEMLPISALDKYDFSPGDLIVLAEMNSPLSKTGLNSLLELAINSDSANTYKTSENLTGCLIAASVCYGCDN